MEEGTKSAWSEMTPWDVVSMTVEGLLFLAQVAMAILFYNDAGLVWLLVLGLALLVAACGPEMSTPTPSDSVAEASSTAAMAPVKKTATPAQEGGTVQENAPTEEPAPPADLPVDADDWHVLGSSDAPITIIEYSDFQ